MAVFDFGIVELLLIAVLAILLIGALLGGVLLIVRLAKRDDRK